MLKTIRAKILLITISILIVLSSVFAAFIFIVFGNVKDLMIRSCDFTVSAFARDVNKDIIEIENNVQDVALLGEIYYSFGQNDAMLEYSLQEIFEPYPSSLGGGVWFIPYKVNPNKKYSCLYVYRDKMGETNIDRVYETSSYNYPEQSWYKEIMSGLKNEWDVEWTKPYFENEGGNTLMVTAGTGIYDLKGNRVGISTVDWEISTITKMLSKSHPTPGSFALFADLDNDYVFASTDRALQGHDIVGKSLKEIPWFSDKLKDKSEFYYNNRHYITFFRKLQNNLLFIINVPSDELFHLAAKHFLILFIVLLTISVFITSLLYLVLDNNMSKPIDKLIKIANKIGQGDLYAEIKLEKPEEFAKLASTFDKMTKDIKNIAKERERIESELTLAKIIQASALPNKFPPYPDRTEFDIYATMEAAKEVGGDFYDFYFIDDKNFMFLIADVSGKGVPAALFMMKIKTLISNIAQMQYTPKEMFEIINKRICADKQDLFITLFACIFNTETGKLTCVNCGHNPPLLKHNDKYEYLQTDSNMILGAFDDAEYNIYETQLNPDDILFLYTDGVTEAVSESKAMYGETRLLDTLNSIKSNDLREVVSNLKTDLKDFIGNMPQSDDTTMMIFKYNEKQNNIYHFKAAAEGYKNLRNLMHDKCKVWGLTDEVMRKLDLVSEEIFVNIMSYGFGDKEGDIEVEFLKSNNEILLRFTDEGIQFNPLANETPDLDLPPEARPIGGLGIYIVKQSVDEYDYERKDGKNILTLKIKI